MAKHKPNPQKPPTNTPQKPGHTLFCCPFCGSSKVFLCGADAKHGYPSAKRIICQECAAKGPEKQTEKDAVSAWNATETFRKVAKPQEQGASHNCPVCLGFGENPIHSPTLQYLVCTACQGTGKIKPDPPAQPKATPNQPGPPASGSPTTKKLYTPREICPNCQGFGSDPREKSLCFRCFGSGSIPQYR